VTDTLFPATYLSSFFSTAPETHYTYTLSLHDALPISAFLLNRFQELDAVIHLLMEAKHWGLRKSRNATSLNSRFKSLDTLKVKKIGRAVQQECRDRDRMPSSA